MTQDKQIVDRPGCVTAYAVLAFVAGGLYIVGSLIVAVGSFSDPDTVLFGLMGAVCVGLFAAIPIATGIGLWKMAKWGWWIVVILNGFGIALGLLYFLMSFLVFATGDPTNAMSLFCGTVIGLAINGGILYWFIQNRSLFESPPVYEKVVGPDGEIIEKEVQKSGMDGVAIVIIVGVFALMCLVPVVVIAILTLLGPQIGEVFSRITADLSVTPMP